MPPEAAACAMTLSSCSVNLKISCLVSFKENVVHNYFDLKTLSLYYVFKFVCGFIKMKESVIKSVSSYGYSIELSIAVYTEYILVCMTSVSSYLANYASQRPYMSSHLTPDPAY